MIQQAFPIVIIDENAEGRHAAGRAVRQLADALRDQGFPVVTGVGYQDARRLARVYHNESSLLICIDGAESSSGQWSALEDLLTMTRRRNTRLPIFLLGDERTAESIPTDVLRHTQAFFQLHEDLPECLARAVGQSARLYVESLLPPLFKALAEYTQRASDAWPPPGHGGGVAFRKSPAGRVFYEFFGENTVRADLSIPVPALGSPLGHSGAVGAAERHAARVFGSDHTLFVASDPAAASRIVWQSMVGRGDLVLCDRSSDLSTLDAMILTGAVPIYLQPSRNPLGLVGPIPRDQLTPLAIRQKVAASASTTSGHVRLIALTNSTHDGICYNVDAIKQALGDATDVLHFDERWFAYAHFHEFYAGHHALSATPLRRARRALTSATQSTHSTLAAFSPAAMLHLLDGDAGRIEPARFDHAMRMHTPASPQYGVLASCDVAAAMMEQPAGRAIVEETIEEALAFRRAVATAKRSAGGPWWFTLWQTPALAEYPVADPLRWRLNAADRWHGFGTTVPDDVLLDPLKVTLLTPGYRPEDRMAPGGIPAAVVTAFLSSRRIEVNGTGPYSFLVSFSIGVTEGRWSTLISELLNFRDLYERNAPITEVLPDLAATHADVYATLGVKDVCARLHTAQSKLAVTRCQDDVYACLPLMAMRPSDAHDHWVRGHIERVEIDQLMNRTVAVPVVQYPPGMPVLMPGERITPETAAIHNFLLRARQFDAECPGFESEIAGLLVDRDASGRRYLVECVKE